MRTNGNAACGRTSPEINLIVCWIGCCMPRELGEWRIAIGDILHSSCHICDRIARLEKKSIDWLTITNGLAHYGAMGNKSRYVFVL